jgi:flagellar basal-body rod protein FlgF
VPYGLYISAEGAQVQTKRLEVISNNLANVDTVGFKRELAVFQSRYAEAVSKGLVSPGNGELDDVGGGVMLRETKTDYSPGTLKHTDVPTDMAIDGEGFFLVEKDGEKLLTRAGNFRLNDHGGLVSAQGYPVLNENNSPVVIDQSAGPWELTRDGTIRQRGSSQRVALVRPEKLNELIKTGENLFRASSDPAALPAGERRVVGGFLEQSSVRPTNEMIELIDASRAVEVNLSIMQTHDQMISGLVNRMMKV